MMKPLENKPMRVISVAVIGRDGSIEHREIPMRQNAPPADGGKVLFPFGDRRVYSDTWRAADHALLTQKK